MGPNDGVDQAEEARLREIHHQVKNNLQVVCSLLRIQARGLGDPAARAIFKRGEERIQSMALVYDTLSRGALFEEVPLHEYLTEMSRQLVQSSSGFGTGSVSCEIEPLFVPSKVATHFGLLINEAISHRLRQKPREGDGVFLSLRLCRHDQGIDIELQDNGPHHDKSVDISPLELQILDALTRQLEGVATYPASDGFVMRIAIPKRAVALME
jgi:two-component sensor histidine kinase